MFKPLWRVLYLVCARKITRFEIMYDSNISTTSSSAIFQWFRQTAVEAVITHRRRIVTQSEPPFAGFH